MRQLLVLSTRLLVSSRVKVRHLTEHTLSMLVELEQLPPWRRGSSRALLLHLLPVIYHRGFERSGNDMAVKPYQHTGGPGDPTVSS